MTNKEDIEFDEMGLYGYEKDEKELETKFPYLKEVSYVITSSSDEEKVHSHKIIIEIDNNNVIQKTDIVDAKGVLYEQK